MKNLSNCKPTEFLKQTIKIKNLVKDWLDVTKIFEINKDLPKFEENTPKEEKLKVLAEFYQNKAWNLIDAMLEKHADKTLALLALVNFVEPENVDDYEVGDYLDSISQLINDERVIRFFMSLVRLDQINTSNIAKK